MTISTFYCAGCYHSKERMFANIHIARQVIPVCRYSCMTNALRSNKVISDHPAIALSNSVWIEIMGSKTPPNDNVIHEESFSPLTRSPKMENVNDFYENDDEQIKSLGENKNG